MQSYLQGSSLVYPVCSVYSLNLFLAALRLFREESSCLSRMTSRTSLFTSLYIAFTKLNVAASNLVDEGLLLLDDLGILSPPPLWMNFIKSSCSSLTVSFFMFLSSLFVQFSSCLSCGS